MNLNKTQLIGRVTKAPDLKALPSGVKVCSFSLATNRTWTKDGQKQEETDFHNIVSFGKTAETIGKWVTKGQLLYVEGRLKTRSWESDGSKKYRTEIILENFQFGPKPGGEGKKPEVDDKAEADEFMQSDEYNDEINPDDIPF